MSLTSHLNDVDSTIRQFVYESAPRLALAGSRGAEGKAIASSFGFDDLTSLATQRSIPEEVRNRTAHAVVAGMALDYRLRMDLPDFDFTSTVAEVGLNRLGADPGIVHRGEHIHKLLQDSLAFAYLTWKDADSQPLSLARASVPLAWCESIVRAGPLVALAGGLGQQIRRAKSATDLMMSIDSSLILDIAAMHKAIEPLVKSWNTKIAAGMDYVPNPRFRGSLAVGGADADIAMGDTLLDIKTRERVTNPWIKGTLFQLLGYTLLDLDDSLGIRKVGILLPRQPHLAVWSLDELLGQDAASVLPNLRERFAGLLGAMQKR